MSVAQILNAQKKIDSQYLPSGLLTNPMSVDLDMAGNNIVGANNIEGTELKIQTIQLNDGDNHTRNLSVGASPAYNLVVDGGATIQGDTTIDGSIQAQSGSMGPLTILPTSGGGITVQSGDIAFTGVSIQSITGVTDITAGGTVQSSYMTVTNDLNASGTVKAGILSLTAGGWYGEKQLLNGTGTIANTALTGTELIFLQCKSSTPNTYSYTINAGSGFTITSSVPTGDNRTIGYLVIKTA